MNPATRFDRRRFLQLVVAWPAVVAVLAQLRRVDEAAAAEGLLAVTNPEARRRSRAPAPTPDCDDDEPTPVETAGPFFKPRSPLRATLIEAGMSGTRIVLTGRVVSQACRPVAGALLDFWHADDSGEYDNEGFRCRGHQYADSQGRYRLETVVPGLYPGRTRHFHVKVQAPHGRIVTTQLYFPGEPRNARDMLFRSDLLMAIRNVQDARNSKDTGAASHAQDARFNFVVRTG